MDRSNAQLVTNILQECLRNWKREIQSKIKRRTIVVTAAEDDEKLGTLEHLYKEGADLKHLEREREFGLIPHVFWCQRLIKFFVDRGADVNSRDENGDTAMHLAIRNVHLDPDDILNDETCPKNNRVDVIKFLLKECAADRNIKNLRGETVFVTLLKTGLWLPEDGMDRGSFWKIAKMIDCESALTQSCHINNRDFLKALEPPFFLKALEPPLKIGASTEDRRSQCSRILIERGVEVNVGDFQNYPNLQTFYEFAKLVFKMGANSKSESGRDCYDLSIYYFNPRLFIYTPSAQSVFTYGTTPAKQVELFEKAGAAKILRQQDWNGGFDMWKKAMDVCKRFKLQPSKGFLTSYKFLRENLYYNRVFVVNEEMCRRATNIVVTLSEDKKSKFWNILSNFPSPFYNFYNMLLQLEIDWKTAEHFASTEDIDFMLLSECVKPFDNWLEDQVSYTMEYRWKNLTPENIKQFHSIANFGIACFDKLVRKTNCNKVSDVCIKLYLTLLHALASLGCMFLEWCRRHETEELFKDNELLLRKLIKLNLIRDGDWNTWAHLIFMPDAHGFNIYDDDELTLTLFSYEFVDAASVLKSKNRMGFEPTQLIDWKKFEHFEHFSSDFASNLIEELADRGAHLDARNCWEERTLGDVYEENCHKPIPYLSAFKHDSLQCACARVLVQSLVPYRTKKGVPKFIVDFINSHMPNAVERRNPETL